MVHAITQIFSTALIMEISLFFLFSKSRKTTLLATFASAPLGWIGEIVAIQLGWWVYSISQLVPIFDLPLPIWLGWVFVTWYGALIVTHLIEFINSKRMKDKPFKEKLLYSWLFGSVIYTGPVAWGILLTMPPFYLYNASMGNTVFLSGFTWNLFDYFGLNLFQYLFWISLMLIGVFFLVLFLLKINDIKKEKVKTIGFLLIAAAALTPLGWGIEFFGINSHTPIWTYVGGNPLLAFGPFGVPIIIYIGWFVILVVCMLVIYKKMKTEILNLPKA